jgi:hypothetical protein
LRPILAVTAWIGACLAVVETIAAIPDFHFLARDIDILFRMVAALHFSCLSAPPLPEEMNIIILAIQITKKSMAFKEWIWSPGGGLTSISASSTIVLQAEKADLHRYFNFSAS